MSREVLFCHCMRRAEAWILRCHRWCAIGSRDEEKRENRIKEPRRAVPQSKPDAIVGDQKRRGEQPKEGQDCIRIRCTGPQKALRNLPCGENEKAPQEPRLDRSAKTAPQKSAKTPEVTAPTKKPKRRIAPRVSTRLSKCPRSSWKETNRRRRPLAVLAFATRSRHNRWRARLQGEKSVNYRRLMGPGKFFAGP